MNRFADAPRYRLTRHFYQALFDLGFLSEAGVQSFTRLILGVCAVCLAGGLLLARVFMVKYGALDGDGAAERYGAALVADHTFLIAVPMWVVACVTVLVGHALFPDETDFRVLMTLPVTRSMVFGAKLAAVALFVATFVVAVHVALAPVLLLTLVSPFAESWLRQAVAYGVGSLAGSAFAVLAVTALQGVLLMAVPPGRLASLSAGFRSAMLAVLVISLPLLLRLPFQRGALSSGVWWVDVTPPAWFAGTEMMLAGRGSTHMARMAVIAVGATTAVALLAAASYTLLYHRFDRVMTRPGRAVSRWRARVMNWTFRRRIRRPVRAAIGTFTSITLRRSALHQGIVAALTAVGLGLALNSFIRADVFAWLAADNASRASVLNTVIWAPFVLIYVAVLASRLALHVPVELRANWIFRIVEHDEHRLDQLRPGVRSVMWLGVVMPALAAAAIQWMVVGADALLVTGATLVWGWLFVEIVMRDWGRIPFTCSYIPGKGFVPQVVLKAYFTFTAFTTLGGGLARFALTRHPVALVFALVVVAIAFLLARRRLAGWRHTTLTFEDELPTDVNPLKLAD